MTQPTVESLQTQVDTLEARIDTLTKERDAAKRDATSARKAASAAKRALPSAPRKIGRTKGEPLTLAELREKIAKSDNVELVFSDGNRELRGFEPRTIAGDAWTDTPGGLKLNVPEMLVHGPGAGSTDSAHSLAGYALLVDGEQVAWAERPGLLTIGRGGTYDLKDDVIFPVGPAEPAA